MLNEAFPFHGARSKVQVAQLHQISPSSDRQLQQLMSQYTIPAQFYRTNNELRITANKGGKCREWVLSLTKPTHRAVA